MSVPPPAGEHPHYPHGRSWTDEEKAAYDAWWDANLEYWGEAAWRLGRLVPTEGVEHIASGYVVTVVYEDRSYAWLGCGEEESCDGPWIGGTPAWVGGYRYAPDRCGELYTVPLMLPVDDPDDMDRVVATMADAARRLGELEFTEVC